MESIEVKKCFDAHVHLRERGENGSTFLTNVTLLGLKGWCCGVIAQLNLRNNILTLAELQRLADYYDQRCEAMGMPKDFAIWLSIKYDQQNMDMKELKKMLDFHGLGSYVKGVAELKLFPDVTTNSGNGVVDFSRSDLWNIICLCDKLGIPVKCHGEVADKDCPMIEREECFIETAEKHLFSVPGAKICMAHVSSKKMMKVVMTGEHEADVFCEVAPQHLMIEYDDAMKNVFHKCMPIAKTPEDIKYLKDSCVSDFLTKRHMIIWATDTAAHLRSAKEEKGSCGVWGPRYTPAYYLQGMEITELEMAKEYLEYFMRESVLTRYPRIAESGLSERTFTLEQSDEVVTAPPADNVTEEIVPMLRGETLSFSVS